MLFSQTPKVSLSQVDSCKLDASQNALYFCATIEILFKKWFSVKDFLANSLNVLRSKNDTVVMKHEAYSEPTRKSKIELLANTVNGFQPLTTATKNSMLDVQSSSEYVSGRLFIKLELCYFRPFGKLGPDNVIKSRFLG